MKPYYDQDGCVIYHGDCREVLPLLHGNEMELAIVTDPPYGINFAGQPTKWQRRRGAKPEAWDTQFAEIDLILKAATRVCVWGGNYHALPPSRGWLAWIKPDAPPSMGSVEFAWTNLDRNARYVVHSISATNAERVAHPTQKPLAVMRWTLLGFPRSAILDPFMGSGTTLVAAKQLGQPAIGIELEEKYCEIAAKRLQQGALPLELGA